jgi:hypothetical protein
MQVCLRFWANESFRSGWGLLRNLVDHSHIRQKACGLWGFGHRAVVLTCFNQCARCPPEWTSEPGSIPTQTLSRTMLDSAATSVYPTACLRSPIGAASKAPSLCNHVSRDVHTARRTAMAGFMKSSMMVFASSLGARATASGCSPATAMILRSVFRRSPWRWRLRQCGRASSMASDRRRSVVAGRQDARSPWHLTSAFRRISQMCYKSVSGCAMTCART